MAKKSGIGRRELMIIIGIALILMGIIGIGNLINILLIVIGGYILYDVLKKRK